MALLTTKEKLDALNSLACLVQALENTRITIDLQNETIVTGIAQEIDGYMNITLEAVQLVNLDGYCYHYDTMYIKGRNIRFIHLPKQLSVRDTILKFLKRGTNARLAGTTALQRFRTNKLQQYQEETRQHVAKMKEQAKSANPSE